MPMYETLKAKYSTLLNKKENSPFISAISGATAAFVSATLTCPFDVIKTRHMTIRLKDSS